MNADKRRWKKSVSAFIGGLRIRFSGILLADENPKPLKISGFAQ
jgi:hypothetical protein